MHKDFLKEQEYLENTCHDIEYVIGKLSEEMKDLTEKIEVLKKEAKGVFSNDLVIRMELLVAKERKLNILKQAIVKPYFGRVDFKDLMEDEAQAYYIGKTNVQMKDRMVVLDWRAPISSLYYSGEIGEVMYQAPGGTFIGDLTLKRQYEIESKKLLNVFDKGITPMDEYLFSALSEKKDNRLKDIVTTIQGEQNEIIRAPKDETLIVQGSAGSGKTTIVLHRIAYLLYTYQEILRAENILVIVPNALFLNYISDVLPDLGVSDINQTTYQKLIETQMKTKFEIVPNEVKLLKMLNHEKYTNEERYILQVVSKFRGSMEMKKMIDDYILELLPSYVPNISVLIDEYEVFSVGELKKIFYDELSYLPLLPRVDRMRVLLKSKLEERVQKIISKIDGIYQNKAKKVKKENSQIDVSELMIQVYDERDKLIDKINILAKKCLKVYFDQWKKIDVKQVYKKLITDEHLLGKYTEYNSQIAEYCKNLYEQDKYEIEDITPIMYLYMELISSNVDKYRHIVIDEAQDYSPFQMYVIKQLNISNSFTIVGDISQGIHSFRGIDKWSELMKQVFDSKYLKYLSLKKCYRSTIEIMNLANHVLSKFSTDDIVLSEPVIRHGKEPQKVKCSTKENMIEEIKSKIEELSKEGHKSIAIICKSSKESDFVYEKLKNTDINVSKLTDSDTEYNGGIIVMPVHLAKGLEFDGVLIYDCSKKNYPVDNICIKLLYVAITRALHSVTLYYTNDISGLLV